MGILFTGIIILLLLLFFTQLSHKTQQLKKDIATDENLEAEKQDLFLDKLINSNEYIYTGIIFCFLCIAGLAYYYFRDSIYSGHLHEWMNILIRWLHITFGIAWIGTSFFFVFMENSMHKNKNRPELKGDMWMLHGGGFWFVEKYQVAPKVMPKGLHWFKYEAYFTWLSGFLLLWVVYYFNAKGNLIDPNINDLSVETGIAIGLLSMLAGWLTYDLLCKTPIVMDGRLFFIVFFLILTGFAWYYTQVFSPRAAYIHVGAVIGTIMAGNVFFGIIPAQKEMVRCAKLGIPLNPELGKNAGRRSMHNNYFTLPILFIMISNHFPSTFGNEWNWVILVLISLGSAAFKHYLNLAERGEYAAWVLPAAVVLILAATYTTAPVVLDTKCEDQVTFTEVYKIFQERCVSCHASVPTDDFYTTPPNGIVYDTPDDIAKLTDKIMQRVVITKTMPQNNKTGMLEEERIRIKCWIDQGAKTTDE